MNELVFFEIPKQNLKIQIVKKSDEILEQIRKESAETAVMPDVAQYYTDIYFQSRKPSAIASVFAETVAVHKTVPGSYVKEQQNHGLLQE